MVAQKSYALSNNLKANSFKLKWLFFFSSSLTVMSGAALAPILPTLKLQFAQLSYAEFLTKILLSLPALMVLCLSPVFGYFEDKFPKSRIFRASLFLYFIAALTACFVPNILGLFVFRLLMGVAIAGIMTSVPPLLYEHFQDSQQRSKALGQMEAFVEIGGIVFLVLAGILAPYGLIASFSMYLISLPIYLWARSIYKNEDSKKSQVKIAPPPIPRELKFKVLPLYFFMFCFMVFFYLIPTQIPFLMEFHGIGKSQYIAWTIGASQVTGAIASLFFSSLKKKFSYPVLLSLSSVLMALGFWGFGHANVLMHFIISSGISGAGLGLLLPTFTLWILDLSAHKFGDSFHGRLNAGLSTALFAGQFSSTFFAELFLKYFHQVQLFTGTGIVLLFLGIAFGLYFLTRKNLKRF